MIIRSTALVITRSGWAPSRIFRGARFDPARMTGVPVIGFVGPLIAGQAHFFGVDDNDVIAAIQCGVNVGLCLPRR